METTWADADSEIAAAQLALLALSASAEREATRGDVAVSLLPREDVLSLDQAAQELAQMEKPLVCSATFDGGVLEVRSKPLRNAGEIERRVYEMHQRSHAKVGGSMSYIADAYGAGDHLIAAFGGLRALILPMSVAEQWHRDYVPLRSGYTGDDVKNPLSADKPEYREANSLGAKGLLRFRCRGENSGTISIEIHEFPLKADASPEELARAEAYLVRKAAFELTMLKLELSGEGDEQLNARNATFRKTVEESRRERRQHLKTTFVPQLKEFFRGREMPSVIQELIELSRSIP
jgi:hypothetical protein